MERKKTKNAPRVSVGLPVYNGERFIEETIDSILTQTFTDFELIISDNGSTDKTVAICETYMMKDSRIRFHRSERNRGAAWNYNYVFSLSKGVYFKWAAHDDLCSPRHLESCVKVLDETPDVILCYPRTAIIDEYSNRIKSYNDMCNLIFPKPHIRFKRYLFRETGEANSVFGLIRASHLKKTNLIGNFNASDIVLLGNLALMGQFYEIPEEHFFRRNHSGMHGLANPTLSGVAGWFDPAKRNKIVFVKWRFAVEYLRSILYTKLDTIERALCLIHLSNWVSRQGKTLCRELASGLKEFHRQM